MGDVLQTILARKAEEVAERRRGRPLEAVRDAALAQPAPRAFAQALRAKRALDLPAVIAEVKKASPSKGLIRADFDPAAIARSYEAGGAACRCCARTSRSIPTRCTKRARWARTASC